MARIKRAVNAKKTSQDIKACKRILWARSRSYRIANEQVLRSLRYSYAGRKTARGISAVCG